MLVCAGCSALRAKPAETSPFLEHAELLRPTDERAPWDAVWSSDPGQIMVKLPQLRRMYVAPVNTSFLNMKRDARGAEVELRQLSSDDVGVMAEQIRSNFVQAVGNHPETNLQIVDDPKNADLIFEAALVELTPTKVLVNTVADVGAVVIPGTKLLEEAAVAGGQAVGGSIASGTIAIEGKFLDGKTGKIVAEFKDRESDPASEIPNYRDFEAYGWSRHTAVEWATQFAEIFSTTGAERIGMTSEFSFVPW